MAWEYKCKSCEGTSLDQVRTRCNYCAKEMVKHQRVDDDYLREMKDRGYWPKRKQLEQSYHDGRITEKQYNASRRFLEQMFPTAGKAKQLYVALERPLITPKSEDYSRRVF